MDRHIFQDQPASYPTAQVDGTPLKPITQVLMEAMVPASRHFSRLPVTRITTNTTSAKAASLGKRTSITPPEVAIPLPPLNFRKGE